MKKLVLTKDKMWLLVIIGLLCSTVALAQTGINTRNPQTQSALHIDGAKDNNKTAPPSAQQVANDVVIDDRTGFIGIGTLDPQVRFDMRSESGSRNAIGVGQTTMTAPDAGMGALRYFHTTNPTVINSQLQTSDGVVWTTTYLPPVKAVVVARMAEPFTVGLSEVDITGWDEERDMANNFEPLEGIFTAPRAGVYTFLLTFNFWSGSVAAGSRVEVLFVDGSGTALARSYKTFGKSHRDTQAGGSATATLQLAEGATVRPRIWQNITSSKEGRALRTHTDYAHSDGGFNNLTIIEH